MLEVIVAIAGPADWADIVALRTLVFVDEQGVPPEIERDDLDEVALHAAARDDGGALVGTGRAVLDAEGPGVARIGRMAVAVGVRGTGVGLAVLRTLEAAAAAAGSTQALLHAQDHAIGFYRRAGYEAHGTPFVEAGIAHLAMIRDLP